MTSTCHIETYQGEENSSKDFRWYLLSLKYVLRTTPRDYTVFERFLQTRRCHGTHNKTRTTLYRFFDDISSSWIYFQTTPSWLFSKHFVGRGDVAKRCIKTRSILQITRWYFPVLKYVLRTTPRDYFFFERFLRTRRCHGKTYQEEKYTSKEIGWRKIVVEWLLKRDCRKKIHRHG